jgi:hypothetical protein
VPATFDGPTKLITITYEGPITSASAADIYSAWKRWVQDGNAQYPEAFANSVGGDALGGGLQLAGYFFVRNDLGWQIAHQAYDHEIRITGDLYPFDPNIPLFESHEDSYSVQFVLQRSSASTVIVVDGAGGGTVDPAGVWEHAIEAGLSAEEILRVLLAVLAGQSRITELGAGAAEVAFRDQADTRDRLVALMDGSERTSVILDPV